MKRFLGLLFAVLLLAVPAVAQNNDQICSSVPGELADSDWGGDVPGPNDVRAYLYPGNEGEGRTGYIDHNPYSSPDPTGKYWLIGTVDWLYCEYNKPGVPLAHVYFDTYARRSCEVIPIGCGFEDCDLSCVGTWPRPLGPITRYISWNEDYQSYLDIVPVGDDLTFEALVLDLSYPRAYLYIGYFDVDEDEACTFSDTESLWVYKIDLLGDMPVYNPRVRSSGERRR